MTRRRPPQPKPAQQSLPPGRPPGTPNAKPGQVVAVHQCINPKCRSTEHERYRLVSCVAHGGFTAAGVEYSHVVRRRTKCLNCGTRRIDKFLENHPPEANPGEENEPE